MPVEILTSSYRGIDEALGDSSVRILKATGDETETEADGRRRGVPIRVELSLAAGGD